jgi:hypothetical protein
MENIIENPHNSIPDEHSWKKEHQIYVQKQGRNPNQEKRKKENKQMKENWKETNIIKEYYLSLILREFYLESPISQEIHKKVVDDFIKIMKYSRSRKNAF